ncbi:T9SS type B sorting domain-containing protein [Ancylomarina sp. YFZ004]
MRLMVLAISNKFRLFLGVFFALILCQSTLFAQISAPTSSYSSVTAYTTGEDQNEIFVFCDEANIGEGELKVVSPDAAAGWQFTWTKWDSGANTFGGTFPVSNGEESILGNLPNGLYRVSVEKVGEVSQVYQAWVINHLKNPIQPSLTKTSTDCSGVHFTSSFIPSIYYYQNFPSDTALDLKGEPKPFTFILKRDDVEVIGRLNNADGTLKSFIDYNAFNGVANFTMTVIDECGFEYTSEVETSRTYKVDARFTFDPVTGEAPLEVNFDLSNENPNGSEYQWYFYKDSKQIPEVDYDVTAVQEDLLTDIVIKEDPVYTYMHPGNYFVKLIVTNNDISPACEDIFRSTEIIVEGSIFEVPNVFTPNGDGKNDKFHLKLYSVKSYSVKIFNRWGRLVYEFQESDVSPGLADRKSSKSWDGKISGKLAAPGTYFYVVEAEGREEEGKHYTEKGALTLLHNK